MNKVMYTFVATRKKKKRKEIDPFLDTVCPFRASRVTKVEQMLDIQVDGVFKRFQRHSSFSKTKEMLNRC